MLLLACRAKGAAHLREVGEDDAKCEADRDNKGQPICVLRSKALFGNGGCYRVHDGGQHLHHHSTAVMSIVINAHITKYSVSHMT